MAMIPKKHASHPMGWETKKQDTESVKYGKEGSTSEEKFDKQQMSMPKPKMK
jgi:hypothetical protein